MLLLSVPVELLQLLEELRLGLHDGGFVPPALRAVPLPFGLSGQLHTTEVEPLHGTQVVVAADHVTVGHLKKNI